MFAHSAVLRLASAAWKQRIDEAHPNAVEPAYERVTYSAALVDMLLCCIYPIYPRPEVTWVSVQNLQQDKWLDSKLLDTFSAKMPKQQSMSRELAACQTCCWLLASNTCNVSSQSVIATCAVWWGLQQEGSTCLQFGGVVATIHTLHPSPRCIHHHASQLLCAQENVEDLCSLAHDWQVDCVLHACKAFLEDNLFPASNEAESNDSRDSNLTDKAAQWLALGEYWGLDGIADLCTNRLLKVHKAKQLQDVSCLDKLSTTDLRKLVQVFLVREME